MNGESIITTGCVERAAVNHRAPGASRGRATINTRGSVWSAVSLAPLFLACVDRKQTENKVRQTGNVYGSRGLSPHRVRHPSRDHQAQSSVVKRSQGQCLFYFSWFIRIKTLGNTGKYPKKHLRKYHEKDAKNEPSNALRLTLAPFPGPIVRRLPARLRGWNVRVSSPVW